MNAKQTHWYPGHMAKAIQAIEAKIKWIDLLVIVADARAIGPCLTLPIKREKPTLYVINKMDLADGQATEKDLQFLTNQGLTWIAATNQDKATRIRVLKALHQLGEPLWQKQEKKGMKRQPLKVMITGAPNVGKSTLINLLAKQKKVTVENRPGTTRGQQWIALDDTLLLLDTPGVLPPRYTNQTSSLHLALIGAMPLKSLPLESLAHYLYTWILQAYPKFLIALHGKPPENESTFFSELGRKRGWIYQGKVDLNRVYAYWIKAFQDGKLGAISLPTLSDEKQS